MGAVWNAPFCGGDSALIAHRRRRRAGSLNGASSEHFNFPGVLFAQGEDRQDHVAPLRDLQGKTPVSVALLIRDQIHEIHRFTSFQSNIRSRSRTAPLRFAGTLAPPLRLKAHRLRRALCPALSAAIDGSDHAGRLRCRLRPGSASQRGNLRCASLRSGSRASSGGGCLRRRGGQAPRVPPICPLRGRAYGPGDG